MMRKLAFVLPVIVLLGMVGPACTQLQPAATPLSELETPKRITPTDAPITAALNPTTSKILAPTDTPAPTIIASTPIPEPRARFEPSATEGQAPFTVEFTNLPENADAYEWDFGDGNTGSTTIGDGLVTHGYTEAGTFTVTLSAAREGTQEVASTATVTVTVEPGPLDKFFLDTTEIVLAPGEDYNLSAKALDQFDNPITGLTYEYRTGEAAGEVDDQGRFTAATEAGSYADAVTVAVVQGQITKTASMDVTIKHGPLDRVLVSPESVTVDIGQTLEFSVETVDAYGNQIPEAVVRWEAVEGVGAVSDDGILTAGTRAGTYDQGLKVIVEMGTITKEATAAILVNPDSPASLSIAATGNIAAGSRQQLVAVTIDQYDNPVGNLQVIWTALDPKAGFISPSGLLTAGEVAGSFQDAIEVELADGELSARADLSIVSGGLSQVVVAPKLADIGIEMTQQFVAVGVDRYGNRISRLKFTWRVETGGGIIDPLGLFTAGAKPGAYNNTVKASSVQGDTTVSQTASVNVEPDRIAVIAGRNLTYEGEREIFVMDADGSNKRQLTSVFGYWPSWSPDGRRVSYHYCSDVDACSIYFINDDGSWDTLLEDAHGMDPAWSPDGSKIAFRSDRDGNPEIYVSDIDGGNPTRLTDNPAQDRRPTWAPDGKKIAFVSDRDGIDQIYVMDADGKNQRRMAPNNSTQASPNWSPDGREILFQSDLSGSTGPAGQTNWQIYVMNSNGTGLRSLTSSNFSSLCPSWTPDSGRIIFQSTRGSKFRESEDPEERAMGNEIYTIDRKGRNLARLTNNLDSEACPRWAPRKRGVDVAEESIVIPNRSTYEGMTVQEANRRVSAAVVRIVTNLGSGSGFIIDSGGLILTNNHVVVDARKITVFIEDGTRYVGTVQGRDLVRDLAVIKIEASDLLAVGFGDLSSVSLGSGVLAIGYTAGNSGLTLTWGSVSGINFNAGSNVIYVQTDAIINEGGGGGPLLNLQGQVIGVVTSAILEDFGLAISVNTVRLYLDRLVEGEIITR